MSAPSARSASTRSPIGRSCIRATPESSYSPPESASTAVNGRNAVPALLRKRLARLTPKLPPTPATTQSRESLPGAIRTPSMRNASSMRRTSSASSNPATSVGRRASAASSSVRLEMLLDPGSRTVPAIRATGARSRYSIACRSERRLAACLDFFAAALALEPAVADRAGALEQTQQAVTVSRGQQRFDALELVAIRDQIAPQRIAIGKADVAPHARMPARQAGEVAEAAAREREAFVGVGARRDPGNPPESKHVRQVAHRGENGVVACRVELAHDRATPRAAVR